jgi:Spy/CpxP family protein refolding chaperone
MKKIHLITVITLLISTLTFAQGGKFREQVKASKVAFITNELNLTTTEAEKFWPLYNTFEDKQREIKKDRIKGYMNRLDGSEEKLSEKEAATLLAQMEKTEDELHQLRKKFVADLKGVLPATKILKLKKADEDFNRKLLKQYKNKRD